MRTPTTIRHDLCSRPAARLLALTLTLGACLGGACSGDSHLDDGISYLGPIATRAAIVHVDTLYNDVVYVAPGDDAITTTRVAIGDPARVTPLWTSPTRDGRGVLVMMGPVSAKQEDVQERLVRLSQDGAGAPVTYEVKAPFNAVALSPDLTRAVLHFTAKSDSAMLQNANQVALVELDGDGVTNFTLNGFGGRLLAVEFPGQRVEGEPAPVAVGGVSRDIAAFLAEGEIVLVDMLDAQNDQVAVPFDEALAFSPAATLLRPGDALYADPALLVRSNAGADVAMLTLVNEPEGAGFTAQVSLIPVGNASDFTLHDSADVPYLVSVNAAAQTLVFTDIRTQSGFSIPLGGPASRVFVRTHDDGDGPVPQAVTWDPGATYLFTLPLDNIESSLGRKPGQLKIQTGVNQLVQLDNDRALIGSGSTLYVVDFPNEQVTPLTAASPYDPNASALTGDVLLLGTPGQDWISTVDLTTLNPESMILDATIASFHYLAGPGKIVVLHDDSVGYLTVVPAQNPSRTASYSAWGYLLEGVLEREPPGDGAGAQGGEG